MIPKHDNLVLQDNDLYLSHDNHHFSWIISVHTIFARLISYDEVNEDDDDKHQDEDDDDSNDNNDDDTCKCKKVNCANKRWVTMLQSTLKKWNS